MANTLNIPERTIAQLSDASNTCNTLGAGSLRTQPYQPLVVRATNHVDNDAAETGSDTSKMALFVSRGHGHPWVKDVGLQHIVYKASNDLVTNPTPTNVTVLFPTLQ